MKNAIIKLNAEIDANKSNPYVKVIGDFLKAHIGANPQDAEKIVVAEKTVIKSLDAMKNEAKKNQSNGMAMLTDAEAFAVVFKYYGIEGQAAISPAPVVPSPDHVKNITQKASSRFDISLDELL